MAEQSEINDLIMETIRDYCEDPQIVELIAELLQYELDIWNRYVPKSEIVSQYEIMITSSAKGK